MIKKIRIRFQGLTNQEKNIVINMMGAFLVKGMALVVSLLTTPAYIAFFNNDATLGLWFTILSVLSWILNFDLGIGNGLRNNLTHSLAENNVEDSKKYISSAYISIGVISIFALSFFSVVSNFIKWNEILNIEENIV